MESALQIQNSRRAGGGSPDITGEFRTYFRSNGDILEVHLLASVPALSEEA